MKTFKNMCAQGDVLFRKIKAIPSEAVAVKQRGPVVVAHSETQHNHQFNDNLNHISLFTTNDPFVSYLRVEKPTKLQHMRDFDTHEEILFDVGDYEIRRQREFSPEGLRRVED